MASEELKKRIKENFEWVDEHGVAADVISANVQLAQYAMKTEKDVETALDLSARTKKLIDEFIYKTTEGRTFWEVEHLGQIEGTQYGITNLGFQLYKLEAPYNFESYMFYMEKNRKYEKRFYVPRRATLKTVVDDLQALDDGKYDEYGLSLPARTGKSTLGVFFLTWVGYRRPWSHSAMGGHSGQLAKRVFKGYDNLTSTPEYTFAELFKEFHPDLQKVVETKSSDPAEYTINLGEPQEFPTFCARGIDGTWTGAVDISGGADSVGYLYVDDLVRDREHSMSPSRLENTYQEFQNKMVDRMNDGAKIIMIGTRWNVFDPLGREEKLKANNPRAFFRKIPALNDKDESNFQYEYKGFSSQYYCDMRDRLEKPEWCAKYMQEPFIREGLLFPTEQLRYFNGIVPDGERKIVAALDPAFGKGDYLSMPICMDYGDTEKYIIDWVYDNRTQGFTVPEIVDKIDQHYIMELKIEKNNGGDLMADNIQKEMDARDIRHCHIIRASAPVKMSKEDKIGAYADYVKRYFQFLLPNKWTEIDIDADVIYKPSDQYRRALDEMAIYSPEGKNIHDDASDAITQLAMMLEKQLTRNKAEAVQNPFRHY